MTATSSTADNTQMNLQQLTLERLAYALLVIIPLAIRLITLGQRTLSPQEASTALRAWQASQGLHPLLNAGSPLLFSLQSATFFIIGATDATARAWPLLAAALLPLAFYLTRDWLGRSVALLAAALIVLSPLANAFARSGDGVSFALLAAAITLAGWAFLSANHRGGWALFGAGVAIALLSGPAGITALITLATLFILTNDASSSHRSAPTSSNWLLFAAALLVGGTLFLTRFDALGLIAINLTQWLQDFSLLPKNILLGAIRMAVDEPFLSLFGLLAILWGLRQTPRIRALSIAAAVAAIIAILQGPDQAYSRAVAAFFLALPTAALLIPIARHGHLRRQSLEQTLFIAVLILLAFLSVYALVAFAHNGDISRLMLFLVILLMSLIVTGVFIWFIGWREVRDGLLISGLILTLLFSTGMLWQLAFNNALPNLARVSPTAALPDVKDLVSTFGDISQRQTGDRWAEEVVLIPGSQSDDMIQWYLRRAAKFSLADGIDPQQPPAMIIAPADRELATKDGYAGQKFALLSNWGVGGIATTNDAIRWLFFRQTPLPPPVADAVNLWVRLDLLDLNRQP